MRKTLGAVAILLALSLSSLACSYKNKSCEACSQDSDCESGLSCKQFSGSSNASFRACGGTSTTCTAPLPGGRY